MLVSLPCRLGLVMAPETPLGCLNNEEIEALSRATRVRARRATAGSGR
jgi:hypothetical protein